MGFSDKPLLVCERCEKSENEISIGIYKIRGVKHNLCNECFHIIRKEKLQNARDSTAQSHKIDERRIIVSYIVAVIAPLVLGGYGMGIGHFFVGRYKRGILILVGTIILLSAIAWFLVAWPLWGAGYTLPWAEYDEWGGVMRADAGTLWPGVLVTMVCAFLIWILQIIDLIRINRTFSTDRDPISISQA